MRHDVESGITRCRKSRSRYQDPNYSNNAILQVRPQKSFCLFSSCQYLQTRLGSLDSDFSLLFFFARTDGGCTYLSLSFSSWPTRFLPFSQESGFADSLQLVNAPVIDSDMKRHFLREPTTTTPFSPNQDPCMVSCTFAHAQRALL